MRSKTIRSFLVAGCFAGAFLPETIRAASWDGNGDPNNDGNWSVAANWDDDANPDGKAIVLPDVNGDGNSGTPTRAITVDGNYTFNGFTLNQTTAGHTNRLVLGGNLSVVWGGAGMVFNVTAGIVVLDKGSYNISHPHSTHFVLPSGAILNATGGYVGRNWNGGASGNFVNNGIVNVSSGQTRVAFYSPDVFSNCAAVFVTDGGTLKADATFVNQGAAYGDGTGAITADNTMRLLTGSVVSNMGTVGGNTLLIEEGATVKGVSNLVARTFDFRMTSPAAYELTNTTLKLYSSGAGALEVMSEADRCNYCFRALDLRGFASSQIKLVDNIDNDPAGSGPERLCISSFYGHNNNPIDTFDLNGYEMRILGGVSAYTKPGSYGRIGNSRGTGVVSFAATGGNVDLGQIFIASGAEFRVEGPASISGLDTGDTTANGGGFWGTFRFNGYVGGAFTATQTGMTSVINISGTNNFAVTSRLRASPWTVLQVLGSVSNASNGGSQFGVGASGMTKSGTGGPPSVADGGRLEIMGHIFTPGSYHRFEIGRKAVVAVGGHFSPGTWWNGMYGSDTDSRVWWINTSPDCGSLVFNGGGAEAQRLEILSKDHATNIYLSYYAASATPVAGTTVTGATSLASATVVAVTLDRLTLSDLSGSFQGDETLLFSDGKTARAYAREWVGLQFTINEGSQIARLPFGTLSIGHTNGGVAWVVQTNEFNNYTFSGENCTVARNLIVWTNSLLDLRQYRFVVALGSNSIVRGVVTNSALGGALVVTSGSALTMGEDGVIDVDALVLAEDSMIVFAKGRSGYIRVDGNQSEVFGNHIAAGRITAERGSVKAIYTALDDHTRVYAIAGGTVFVAR